MGLYRFLDRTPLAGTFVGKLFAVAFVGTHLPILALIGYLLIWQPASASWPLLVGIVLIATLAGTVWAFVALFGLLRPMREAARVLATFNQSNGQANGAFPIDHPDEIGKMLRDLRTTMDKNRRLMRELRAQASLDSMTGALNRRGLIERIDQSALRSPSSLIVLDLDNLKELNDRHGHDAGDRALCELSDGLLDEVGDDGEWLARWGGDEFVLILRDGPEVARNRFARRIESIRSQCLERLPVALSVSAGIAGFDRREDFDRALAQADSAMYAAKRNAPGRIEIA